MIKKFQHKVAFLAACFVFCTSVFGEDLNYASDTENQVLLVSETTNQETNADLETITSELIDQQDSLDDLDSLFEEAVDSDEPVKTTTAEAVGEKIVEDKKGIKFNGNLTAELGGKIMFEPSAMDSTSGYDFLPLARFSSFISFTSRPTDYFFIKGTLLAEFPVSKTGNIKDYILPNELSFGIYELYFDYIFAGFAYISAGKKVNNWSHTRIFDSNILKDNNDSSFGISSDDLLSGRHKKIADSDYGVTLNIPLQHINITGIFNYDIGAEKGGSIDIKNITYAAMVEANFWKVNVGLFGKIWAANYDKNYREDWTDYYNNLDLYNQSVELFNSLTDEQKEKVKEPVKPEIPSTTLTPLDPAIGINASFDFGGLHAFTQGYFHISNIGITRGRINASAWWATNEFANLAFLLEYEGWFNNKQWNAEDKRYVIVNGPFHNSIAFQAAWLNVGGTKIALGLKFMHDFYNNSGTVVPGLKVIGIVKSASLDFGIPIEYGKTLKIGMALHLKLGIDF